MPVLISHLLGQEPAYETQQQAAINFCQDCGYLPSFIASPPLAGTNLYFLANSGIF